MSWVEWGGSIIYTRKSKWEITFNICFAYGHGSTWIKCVYLWTSPNPICWGMGDLIRFLDELTINLHFICSASRKHSRNESSITRGPRFLGCFAYIFTNSAVIWLFWCPMDEIYRHKIKFIVGPIWRISTNLQYFEDSLLNFNQIRVLITVSKIIGFEILAPSEIKIFLTKNFQ